MKATVVYRHRLENVDHMPHHPIPLPLSYRAPELSGIFRTVRAGDSCSIVAASGMAKSNLFRYLVIPEVRAHYLGEKSGQFIFVTIDANEAQELNEREISDLMRERIIEACRTSKLTEPVGDSVVKLSREAAVGFRDQPTLVDYVTHVLKEPSTQLVFVFDQFDAIYKSLEGRFFANLRAVRDRNKYRISFITFTRTPLGQLCRSPEHEEFEELFGAEVIGLGPYSKADALLLVERVSTRYGSVLPKRICERLISLTGGHPGMLKAATVAIVRRQLKLPREHSIAAQTLLNDPDVFLECNNLWSSVSRAEQVCLLEVSSGQIVAGESEPERLLKTKGLVRAQGTELAVSIPIFVLYVLAVGDVPPITTRMSAGCFRIDSAGEVWVNQARVTPALSRRELLLLEYLCLQPGQLRTKDEVIAVVYPDEFKSGESISDDALNALFKRLRERLNRFEKSGDRIITVRGKGYRLNTS